MSKVFPPISYQELMMRLCDSDQGLECIVQPERPDAIVLESMPNPSLVSDISPQLKGYVGMGLTIALLVHWGG